MSPFKVIRCRYYTEDGKAVPPYCSAGRHCTFLHPNDKGWPGGDPLPEIEKRSEERDRPYDRSRPRAAKSVDHHIAPIPHERRISRGGTISLLDLCSSENLPPRKGESYSSKDPPPVHSIVQTFHDIAKFQTKLTQDREALHETSDKLTSFRELSKSLSKVSATSAAAVAPTLDAIIDARQELQKKVDDDMKQISDLWNNVLNVFLRAICRQFDNELESGTEYLRQEARVLLKSFPRSTSSYRRSDDTASALSKSSSSRTQSKPQTADASLEARKITSKETSASDCNNEDEYAAGINPPVGTSDNGWGRKRRRLSSESDGHDRLHVKTEDRSPIAELQKQLNEQNEKIAMLTRRNEELESTVRRHSALIASDGHTSDIQTDSIKSSSPDISSDSLSPRLRDEILALIAPTLEQQKKINESWETRLVSISEKLREMSLVNGEVGEDVAMGGAPEYVNVKQQID